MIRDLAVKDLLSQTLSSLSCVIVASCTRRDPVLDSSGLVPLYISYLEEMVWPELQYEVVE
eukprot:291027-Amphidinium_carterae.1